MLGMHVLVLKRVALWYNPFSLNGMWISMHLKAKVIKFFPLYFLCLSILWMFPSLSYAGKIEFLPVQSEYVYHGSLVKNLTILKPQKSTHGKDWVYGVSDPAIAASFIVKASDFDFAFAVDDDGVFSVTERYKGAFNLYKGESGSLYKLSSDGFLQGQTSWDVEAVSTEDASVLEEIVIADAYKFLKELESLGCIHLYYYPNRPSFIPADDSDLVSKAVLWTKESATVREQFLQLHPHLKEQFELALDQAN